MAKAEIVVHLKFEGADGIAALNRVRRVVTSTGLYLPAKARIAICDAIDGEIDNLIEKAQANAPTS